MWAWLNENETGKVVFSWLKNFVAIMIGFFVASGADVFSVTGSDLTAWLAAALTATLPTIVNYLNPNYERYGVGTKEDW